MASTLNQNTQDLNINNFSFDCLKIVKEERKKFGLRTLEFHKYSNHCGNKLKNLRKKRNKDSSKQKNLSNDETNQIKDANDLNNELLIHLFESERCWTSFRELEYQVKSNLKNKSHNLPRSLSSSENKLKNNSKALSISKLHHHSHRRLLKAIKFSQALIDSFKLHSSTSSDSTRILAQVQVYGLYLKALLDLESARWISALDRLSVCCVILKSLGDLSRGSQTDRAMFNEWIDDLAPLIRYSAYQVNLSALDVEEFSKQRVLNEKELVGPKVVLDSTWTQIYKDLIEPANRLDRRQEVTLRWRDKLIPIRNPDLVEIIMAVSNVDKTLFIDSPTNTNIASVDQLTIDTKNLSRKEKRQKFLEVKNPKLYKKKLDRSSIDFQKTLLIYTEVESSLQNLIQAQNRAQELDPTTITFNQISDGLLTIHAIIRFRLLSTRVQRDLELVESLNKKLSTRQANLARRINNSKNYYERLDALMLKKSSELHNVNNNSIGKPEKMKIEELLCQKRQVKVYPSLIKLYEDIIFNLETIKQLIIIEADLQLSNQIDCKIAFYKANRSYIQSQSYYLIDRFLEAYTLQQHSTLCSRQAKRFWEESRDDEEMIDDDFLTDPNFTFFNFDPQQLIQLESDQLDLQRQIARHWYAHNLRHNSSEAHTDVEKLAQAQLQSLTLGDEDGLKPKQQGIVFDLAFNYLTQFPTKDIHPVTRMEQNIKAVDCPTDPLQDKSAQEPTEKKAGGLWSFLTRRG
ncbi:hypothetical protein O181_013155 [Austropuccinia psidii MF-1]|uniref:Signal recognition particle subunit SRP68 n=1 Tax=Austropuccinia psidii MF-1 TaxID=1389203 RepID=A0A9Q3GNM5_9BASI|nr:hypothetical protein [Austropuccinia psidii MF-1]